jgi:hypothetical protein
MVSGRHFSVWVVVSTSLCVLLFIPLTPSIANTASLDSEFSGEVPYEEIVDGIGAASLRPLPVNRTIYIHSIPIRDGYILLGRGAGRQLFISIVPRIGFIRPGGHDGVAYSHSVQFLVRLQNATITGVNNSLKCFNWPQTDSFLSSLHPRSDWMETDQERLEESMEYWYGHSKLDELEVISYTEVFVSAHVAFGGTDTFTINYDVLQYPAFVQIIPLVISDCCEETIYVGSQGIPYGFSELVPLTALTFTEDEPPPVTPIDPSPPILPVQAPAAGVLQTPHVIATISLTGTATALGSIAGVLTILFGLQMRPQVIVNRFRHPSKRSRRSSELLTQARQASIDSSSALLPPTSSLPQGSRETSFSGIKVKDGN